MATERAGEGLDGTQVSSGKGDTDARKDEPIEEAEKDLSRYSTSDSRPPVEEQGRTSAEAHPQQAARESRADREADRKAASEAVEDAGRD